MTDPLYSIVVGSVFGIVIYFLLLLDEKQALAPDSAYYLEMGKGEKVPVPFCFRWLLPSLCRQHPWRWQVATGLGIVLQSVGVMLYTHGDWRAPLLLGGLPALWRFSIRHPVLVDPLAMGLALLGASLHLPWYWTAILAMLAGGVRESAPVWMAIYAWNPVPLIGLVTMPAAWTRYGRKTNTQDNLWITEPFAQAISQRRGQWWNWRLMIVPWGVILPLALLAHDWRVLVAGAIGYAPLLCTSDYARIYQWSAPVLIAAALTVNTPFWPLLLLLHWSNGYRGA